MNNMAMNAGKNEMEMHNVGTTKPPLTNETVINWEDFNFPPCLNLVHFSLSELRGPLKKFVLNAYVAFLLIVMVEVCNSNYNWNNFLSHIHNCASICWLFSLNRNSLCFSK